MKSSDPPDIIQVKNGSILELKAQLSKKQAQLSRRKDEDLRKVPPKALRLKSLKTDINKPKSSKVDIVDSELEASWVALQRKTKEYDRLQQLGDDAEDENILVDFLMKEVPVTKKSKFEIVKDEYVEAEDEFGRTRLVKKDTIIAQPTVSDYAELGFVKETGEELSRSTKHFDHTGERRNMGQGFYQFSKDQESRQGQMNDLNRIRIETLQSRSNLEKKKLEKSKRLEERKALIKEMAALRKSKIGIREGQPEALDFLNSI